MPTLVSRKEARVPKKVVIFIIHCICYIFYHCRFQKICTLRGWTPNDPKYVETHETMIKIWDGLRQRADANKDGQVIFKPLFFALGLN